MPKAKTKRSTSRAAPRSRASPRRRVLLVIDMLNGFLDPKGSLYCGRAARKIIPFVGKKISEYRRAGRGVIFLCDAHADDDPEFGIWPAHCVRGTWEARIVPEIDAAGCTVLGKTTISSVYRTRLVAKLRRLRAGLVEVVGLCTNICVLLAAAELGLRGYRVRVLSKGTASFDRSAHRFALRQAAAAFGAEVV